MRRSWGAATIVVMALVAACGNQPTEAEPANLPFRTAPFHAMGGSSVGPFVCTPTTLTFGVNGVGTWSFVRR
jgi:hypothetical protein